MTFRRITEIFSKKELVIMFAWLCLWLSIGAELPKSAPSSILGYTAAARFFLPICAFLIAVGLLFNNPNIPKLPSYIAPLLASYTLIIISSYFNNTPIELTIFPINSLISILLLAGSILNLSDNRRALVILMLPSALFISAMLVIFTAQTIYIGYSTGTLIGYHIGSDHRDKYILSTSPLPTGLARSAFLLMSIILYLYWRKYFRPNLTAILCGVCFGLILYFQSRGVLLASFLAVSIIAIIQWKFVKLNYLILTIFFLSSLTTFALLILPPAIVQLSSETAVQFKILRNVNPESVSSGRLQNWQTAIEYIIQKPLMGWGSQADRILILQNISSFVLYILLCGGLFALMPFVFLGFKILVSSLALRKAKSFDSEKNYALLVMFFLTLRGLTENSFGVFSIDFLAALISITAIFDGKLKKNN